MRKILTLTLIALLLTHNIVYAEVKAPQWSEFCPQKYLNATYPQKYPLKYKVGFFDVMLFYTVIGIPFVVNRAKKHIGYVKQRYWAVRREQFNQSIASCEKQSDKNSCYILIRQLEETKNNVAKVKTETNINYYP